MTEHSFQGIHFLLKKGESVTHVSGTKCHLCVRPLIAPNNLWNVRPSGALPGGQWFKLQCVAHAEEDDKKIRKLVPTHKLPNEIDLCLSIWSSIRMQHLMKPHRRLI